MHISSNAIRKTWELEESLCVRLTNTPHLAQLHVIEHTHEQQPGRVISVYSDTQQVFVRCGTTKAIIEVFHMEDHDADERLAKYRLAHPIAN
jgi:hypothetical protein